MTKHMGMESTCILMELRMLEIGQMTFKMDMVKKPGQMVQVMKDSIRMETSMEKDSSSGRMEQRITESLITTILRVRVFTFGQIRDDMRVNGKITRWKELEFLLGQMVDHIMEVTVMTRKKVLVFSDGQTIESILENGTMEFSMDMEG